MGGLCGTDKKKAKISSKEFFLNYKEPTANAQRGLSRINNTNYNNNQIFSEIRPNRITHLDVASRSDHEDQLDIRRNMFLENSQNIDRILDIQVLHQHRENSKIVTLIIDPDGNVNHINSLDNNGNNLNISINDELSMSRYNNINNINRNNYFHFIRNENRPISSNNIPALNNYVCSNCSSNFRSNEDLDLHYINCRRIRDNQGVHNSINEIFRLFQSLNTQFRMNERMILLDMLTGEEPEDQTEYIDWEIKVNQEGFVYWKNAGRVSLTKEFIKEIAERSIYEIVNEKYYIKRIWFLKYINTHIYDKSGNNTTLVVSRENILEESFNQFMTTDELDLKKVMHIFFIDEVAHDIGGVYREWYTNLFEKIFSNEHNFFYQIEDNCAGKNSYFIPTTIPKKYFNNYLDYYEFIGKVLSKAIFDKITLKTNLSIILIKHLLNLRIELEDLRYLDNSYYRSLKSILENKIDAKLGLTFTWNTRDKFNNFEEIELIPDGKNILITDANKKEFVEKVIELITYNSIKEKVDAMLKGFYSLIPQRLVKIFSPFEFDFLLSGQTLIDLEDWMSNTMYKGYYNEKHPTIKMFWDVLRELPPDKLTIFFRFCTGGNRVPIDGFNSLPGTRNKYHKFCIENPIVNENKNKNRLIEAKTCFNRIYLPDYKSKDLIVKAINTIIENDTNFFGKE